VDSVANDRGNVSCMEHTASGQDTQYARRYRRTKRDIGSAFGAQHRRDTGTQQSNSTTTQITGYMEARETSESAFGAQHQGSGARSTRSKTGRTSRTKRTSYGTSGINLNVGVAPHGAHHRGEQYDQGVQHREYCSRKQGREEGRTRRWKQMSLEINWGCEAGDVGD
jgi:hypothetical protein